MSSVFISYRRDTAAGEARALYNDLVGRLGKGAVFMDVDSVSLGRDFRKELQKTVAACDVMLVLIDKNWAAAKDAKGRIRLENSDDFVRMEVETALKRDIVVTPILLKGAQMPAAEELPAEISHLAYRSAFELSHSRWQSDVGEMIRRLRLEKGPLAEVPVPQALPQTGASTGRGLLISAAASTALAVVAYAVLWIGQAMGIVGTATGDTATTTGSILTALVFLLGALGVLIIIDHVAPMPDSIHKVLGGQAAVAVVAYTLLWICQAMEIVGTATGDTATTTGSILTALIFLLGTLAVLAKINGVIQVSQLRGR
jgi:TIR domain